MVTTESNSREDILAKETVWIKQRIRKAMMCFIKRCLVSLSGPSGIVEARKVLKILLS